MEERNGSAIMNLGKTEEARQNGIVNDGQRHAFVKAVRGQLE